MLKNDNNFFNMIFRSKISNDFYFIIKKLSLNYLSSSYKMSTKYSRKSSIYRLKFIHFNNVCLIQNDKLYVSDIYKCLCKCLIKFKCIS